MTDKMLRISGDLHKRVKLTATMQEVSIKDWVEAVLADALDGRPAPSVLVDPQGRYRAQEEPCPTP